MTKLPVKRTANPTKNAPTWALGLLGLLAGVKGATDGWPIWAIVVTFVACVIFGIVTQVFTKPAD